MDAKDIRHLNPETASGTGAPSQVYGSASPEQDDSRLDIIAEVHAPVLDTISGFDLLR